jgi:hypothetical protein
MIYTFKEVDSYDTCELIFLAGNYQWDGVITGWCVGGTRVRTRGALGACH